MLLALGVGIVGGVSLANPPRPHQIQFPTDVTSVTITPHDIYGNPK